MKECKRYLVLLVCLVLCISVAGISRSSAYFTTYTKAIGGRHVVAKDTRTVPEETPEDYGKKKVVAVSNTGEVPCWARVKVIHASQLDVDIDVGEGWSERNGYYYYGRILQPGEKTADNITVSVTADKEKIATDFNVVVITESIPVTYNEDGSVYAPTSDSDWELAASEWTREVY